MGLTAVVFWSTNVGLMRSVSESFGTVAGAALIYSVAAIILLFTVGLPKLSSVPRTYLLWGSLLFIAYELCFALSIGYAQNGRQAIEVGMINYLWPSFTLLNTQLSWSFWQGVMLVTLGAILCWWSTRPKKPH